MFEIFKNKQKVADKEFKEALSLFTKFFSEGVDFMSSNQARQLVATVFEVYLERNPEEAGQTVFEFYFNSLTGNICEAIGQGNLDKHTGLLMWRQTNRFLLEHPDFSQGVVKLCMNNWKSLLLHSGVDGMNFDIA
jgi:hypothetical protein